MHAGFVFLEMGTVRHKNQVNALVKILTDFGASTLAYFFVGYQVAYATGFLMGADQMMDGNGFALVKFFFLVTFAAAIPAIISGGIAERGNFWPMMLANVSIVALVYPLFEGMIWNGNFGFQQWIEDVTGSGFHDFAGSVVVHGVGGWLALIGILFLGPRSGRVRDGKIISFAPSSIPFLALGAWILTVGWFGFNVMSAQAVEGISGLVAVNSLMAMVGGTLAALVVGKNDLGFIHNGPLAGLVAVCAGSDVLHPLGALATGLVAGGLFVSLFVWSSTQKTGRCTRGMGPSWDLWRVGRVGLWNLRRNRVRGPRRRLVRSPTNRDGNRCRDSGCRWACRIWSPQSDPWDTPIRGAGI